MATQKDSGLVSRAVREALGTLVSPSVSSQVVERSLKAAGLGAIPEGGPALTSWVEGPLRAHVESAVGIDAAELVAAQLAPIVAHAQSAANNQGRTRSEKRIRTPDAPAKAASSKRDAFSSEQPTGLVNAPPAADARSQNTARMSLSDPQRRALRTPPGPVQGSGTRRPQGFQVDTPLPARRVLAASTAADAVAALQRYLGSAAQVEAVDDLVGLLDALEEPSTHQPIVLIDCQRPTVHVTSVAAIGEDLPKGTTVVLWGASETSWKELDRERTPSCRWVRCSQEATTDDLGSLCAMLIGSSAQG